MLKLESGSLFSKLKSLNIHLSVFPSIVKNFAEAFRTFKMTGAEVAAKKSEAELNLAEANKMNAEAESIRIDNKGKELEIVASQMSMMRELLQIDESNSEAIEDLQKSYDIEYEPEDCEILYLEQLMSRERNPELKEAMQDWCELSVRYIAGCYFIGEQRAEGWIVSMWICV